LVAYDVSQARQIIGRKTDEIAAILWIEGRGALIHRNDMVLHPSS